ncbi:hypothetical protein D3C85_1848870 [compost metagenome]
MNIVMNIRTLTMTITTIMTIHTAMITIIIMVTHILIRIMEMPLLAPLNRHTNDKRSSIILEERFFVFSVAEITA